MRVSLIHTDQELQQGKQLALPQATSHYLGTVLRLKPGAKLRLFNGHSPEFAAEIIELAKKRAVVLVGKPIRERRASPLRAHLGLGLIKGDRFDWALQKATEMGVTEITPLFTEFSEMRFKQADRIAKKMEHWQRVIINACEQSGNLCVPELSLPKAVSEWVAEGAEASRLCLAPGNARLAELEVKADCRVLIGPEGGFSQAELDQAIANDYQLCGLGERVLRAETAPVAVMAILQSRLGDI